MGQFKGTDFQITLPDTARDESTYAFAFPARGKFCPSVVVKTERLKEPVELPAYIERQLQTIRKTLPHFTRVEVKPAVHKDGPAFTSVYDWGDVSQRVRQIQRYILLENPKRIVTLTGTSLTETFGQVQELFEAVFQSFHVLPPNPTKP